MVLLWMKKAPISVKAAFICGYILASVSILICIWSCLAVILSKKLRKPLWIFRFSVCIKDVVLCLLVLFHNSKTNASSTEDQLTSDLYISGCIIMCISSSIFTLLCSSIDRFQAASRPFRYHIGQLMPVGVALTLQLTCWTIAAVVAIAVISDYSQSTRYSYGVMIPYVTTEQRQKALLLCGLSIVYLASGVLLLKSISEVIRQKHESRFRLQNGKDEPLRSRKNSAAEDQCQTESDSEGEAAQSMIHIEDAIADKPKGKKRKWSLTLTEKPGFFTPTTYRPSILRRVRDTYYVYVVVGTWFVTLFTVIVPFYYGIIFGDNCIVRMNIFEQNTTQSFNGGVYETRTSTSDTACVISGICDCLILSHGLICSIIYIFVDDVFRPIFLSPVTYILMPFQIRRNGTGSDSTSYSKGRRRTLSRNSYQMTSSI